MWNNMTFVQRRNKLENGNLFKALKPFLCAACFFFFFEGGGEPLF